MGSRKLERTSEGTGSLATHLLQLEVQLVHDERCTANHSCAGKKKNRRHTFEVGQVCDPTWEEVRGRLGT